MVREAPRIETDRLILRPWRKEDFRPWLAIMQRPETSLYLGSDPLPAEDVWRRLVASVGSWTMLGFGSWAVTIKGANDPIGNVGLFNSWRDLEPEFGEQPEMGWILSPDVHGRGYAREACAAALAWAEANLDATPVWAIIDPGNTPSLNLAAKLGFERVGETTYKDEPTIVLKRPAW